MHPLSESPRTKVEWTVSTGTVLKVVGILFILWFVYFIRDIIAIFFVALILSSIIDPLADWFEVRRVPRAVGGLNRLCYHFFHFRVGDRSAYSAVGSRSPRLRIQFFRSLGSAGFRSESF